MQENVPLAPLTTFKVGGPARFFLEARTISEINAGVAFARSRSLPLFVLGGGSNLVVSDSGWPGLSTEGLRFPGGEQRSTASMAELYSTSGAGEEWDKFVARAVARKLRRRRVPERHPRQRGRNSGAERRRLRAEVAERPWIRSQFWICAMAKSTQPFPPRPADSSYRSSIFNGGDRGRSSSCA